MAYPAATYSFSNDTTADATQVNQNFTDIINGVSDGTKDVNLNKVLAPVFGTEGATSAVVKTNDVVRMSFTSTGAVGVGTTQPIGDFEFARGNAATTFYIVSYSDSAANHASLSLNKSATNTVGSKQTTAAGDYLGGIVFRGVNTSGNFGTGAKIICIQSMAAGASFPPAGLIIQTANDSQALQTRLCLTSSGNVAIGTNVNSASERLDVTGRIKASEIFITNAYTVASLPTAVTGGITYVSNETGGAVLAYGDGTNWRRVTDGTIVS